MVAYGDDYEDEDSGSVGDGDSPIDWAFGRIAFARIESLTLAATGDPVGALHASLVPGTRIDRFRRTWLMGRVRDEDSAIVGRIGYQTPAIGEVWDEEEKDFHDETRSAGFTSTFAIRPEQMRAAFQLRPGFIRPNSFTGALQALLNEASPTDRWRVSLDIEEITFDEWRERVDGISELTIRLDRPNPHYHGRERVKRLVEGANARMADLAFRADPNDPAGIDVNDSFIQEAIDHAKEYGDYTATGRRDGWISRWRHRQQGAVAQVELPADPETHEVNPSDLNSALDEGQP
jgi:hypothetical protein